jgi:hypothetical protein
MSGAPTPRQLSYLADLVKRSGQTQDEWRESKGLYESTPWGRRLRTESITRAAVSTWIGELAPVASGTRTSGARRRTSRYAYTSGGARMTDRASRCEDAPCCGCCD